MDGISAQLEAEYPDSNKNLRALVTPAQEQLVKNIRPAILLLTGAVALVLLIACANVANLLLARAVDRQKEIAVRIALGAGRLRIVRQLIVESVVLSCVGGAAGLLVTTWVVSFLTGSAIASLPRIQNVGIEWRVVVFALALAVVTGVIFGLVPALHATRTPIRASLNEESRGGSGSVRQRKLHSSLVVLEVCVALVLLVGAGLLLRSFAALTNVPPGFNAANLLVVNLPLSPQKYQDDVSRIVGRRQDRLAAFASLPGVEAAGMTTMLPMAGAGSTIHFNRAAYPPKGPDDYVMAGYRAVTPGYLSTLGVSAACADACSRTRSPGRAKGRGRQRIDGATVFSRSRRTRSADSARHGAVDRFSDHGNRRDRRRHEAVVRDRLERGDVRSVPRSIPIRFSPACI